MQVKDYLFAVAWITRSHFVCLCFITKIDSPKTLMPPDT